MRWWVLVLAGLTFQVSAQDFARYNWYFGNSSTAIRFSRSDNSASLVTNQKLPFGTGGSAVASNPVNADLMFYTDGSRIYDISGTATPMPNGTGLLANTSGNQPVAICPVPGAPNQYYVFTNSASGTTGGSIVFSIVDMTLPGNSAFGAPFTGEVTTKNQAIAGLTNRSEAMIVVPHVNGTDYWLITHENQTDNYTVTLIQPAGVFANTNFGNLTGGLGISASNFAYHEGTGRIAVSPLSVNRNVAILDFDNATGLLSFNEFVLNTASNIAGAIYDTEWSPSGRYLYISRRNDSGADAQVLQYDTTDPTASLVPILPVAVNSSYGIQIAPDTAIYHIYQATAGGPFRIGRLTDTDSVGTLVQYEPVAFASNPDFNGTQFPSFSPAFDLNLSVSFVTAGTCSNSPISFFPTVTPHADSLVWDFGDGQGSANAWSPVYTYQNGGAYNVTVTAYLNGETASASNPINLTQFDLQLQLVQDTTACRCELPARRLPDDSCPDFEVTVQSQGGLGTATFTWSTGETGPTLRPDSAGYYYVVATDATGCTTYAGVNIREYGLQDQRANIWYFGQNAGIDFNEQPPVSISGPVNSPEGVAVISNRNGQVILSTDGVRVYDRNDVEITQTADGTPVVIPPGIGGESGSTQSALIIPVPGDETLYYIFTTQEVHGSGTYELRYSLFDVKENNGDGGLIEFNQLLFTRSTERITGNANWLIAHEYGNNSFRAYRITPNGILSPVISSIGSDHTFNAPEAGQGYMKLGAQNLLAVALSNPGVSNVLEIFDFDDATGIVSNLRVADLNSATGQVYGVEFFGNKIFATLRGTNSPIREFFINYQGQPELIEPPLNGIAEELGAIQFGPDGQLYVAINNGSTLGTIIVNPDTLQVSTFNPNGFTLTSGQSQLGLPNFIQNVGNPVQPPGMIIAGFCEGEPTLFSGFGTDPIDQFFWTFGDGFTSDSAQVQHLYPVFNDGIPRDYVVTLRITNRCGLDTLLTQTITIYPPPSNPTFLPAGVPQPVLCDGSLLLEALPASTPNLADLTFLWSTGETTREITVSHQTIISVTITNNVSGCTSAGSIIVADNRPPLELGPDQTLCQNQVLLPLDAMNPGAVYEWRINGAVAGTDRTQPVDSSQPGVFQYTVSVTDPITTCVARDTVTFTFNESPAFTAIPSNTAACGTNTGQIALTISSPVGSLFSYFITGPSTTLQGIDQSTGPVVDPGLTALGAGTYGITVADQISGCATITTVGISDNVIDIISAVAQTPTCDPVAIDVQTTGIATINSATYRITNSGTGTVVVPSTLLGAANFTTLPVAAPGNYTIEVSADGCIATEDITITPDNPVAFTIATDGCSNPVTLTVTGGTDYSWSGPNITSATNIASITATPPQGPQTYTVTVSEPGFCPVTQDVVVQVNNDLIVDFTQSDACEAQVTLTATTSAPGNYTYIWTRNGTPIPGGQTILANTADHGATYTVTVQNAASGCSFDSPPHQVIVANLQLAMLPTQPCEGSPFTLTATSNQAGTNFQWSVNGSDIVGATNATLVRTTGGLYRITGTVPGCTRFVENQITLLPSTPGALPQRAIICNNPANPDENTRQVLLDPGAGFISYEWSQGGVPLGITDQTLLVVEPGVYSVDLTNSFGCVSTDITEVIELCKPRIVAPTAFRPGSTIDENREFGVLTFFIDDSGFEVFIFNRWGEMVYQSNDRLFRWNGGYNNNFSQLLPAGTYTYVVKYRSIYEEEIQEQRGGVVLMR